MRSSKFYKNKSRKPIYHLLSLILLVVVGIFFSFKNIFKINELEIDGTGESDIASFYEVFSKTYKGISIFDINDSDIKVFVEDSFPSYAFKRKIYIFPSKLLIEVESRNEIYTISDSNGSIFSIDSQGYVFKVANEDSKVDVRYDKPIEIGNYLNEALIKAAFLYVFDEGEVIISGNEISMNLDSGGKVILPKNVDKSDISRINETLQKIVQKYTIENRGIEYIDMRFSKPVIKFK
ncbi:hypothetical protein CO058_00950 [candidate division WWE3 bacterium CG_4_9_14_0_2_um_filter_35_11]|uniref:POTRA domain-containing protein n=1 Tax=candidate division WWE3 bacterium CG_4_9_14_0_2_um_filter_35_11 TaxID=1975077 RepID=A0A2M8EMH8_UNCKA|nr:MAG: hypothetical protein COV25_03205 [candidate division WWE3 bacterium CG10_big_fil_rev_8_21_14_0_10_35_32]PJC23887.1 MAG: hypothetical protein CO058_00950 [candidate division WWE3 bacterium CG_4_9_14_0_2_um_filter_35_11]